MRKIAVAIAIVGALAASTVPADAQYYGRGHHGGGYHGGGGGHHRGHGGGGHHRGHGGGGHHRGHGGGGWIAPLIGGLVLGGAIYGLSQPSYAAPPAYYAPPQYRTECQIVPVYDRHGYFRGERRECYQVPNY